MDMLHERLAPFRLGAVLLGIARVAALLRTWQNELDFVTDRLLAQRHMPTYYGRIQRVARQGQNRIVFTRLSLLFVAKQACCASGVEGREVDTPADVEQILVCCLLANDLLLERMPTPRDTLLDKAASLLPFSNHVPRNSYPRDLARNLLLIEEIGPQLAGRRDYIDIAAAFTDATGLSPRNFCELAFGAAVKFITNIETQMNDPGTAFLLTAQYFQHTTVAIEDVTAFLNRLSINMADLSAQARWDTLGTDFLAFQRCPLVEYTTGTYLCPDPGFLMDKAGPSLYWTLHYATNRRADLLAYWCGLIERYVQWLFSETYQGRGKILASPQFTNGDQACDLCLIEGSTMVLFEVKASILTVQAKYGFSPTTLRDELRRKAISGDSDERKGVAQLSHNLERFLNGDDINGISCDAIKTAYPVLVFLDHGFTGPYLNAVYNESFNSAGLRRHYRRTITPMFSLSIDDLENSLPYTHEHEFTDILYSYYRANVEMHAGLSHSKVPILKGGRQGRNPIGERFNQFVNDLERRFFRCVARPNDPSGS